MKTILGENTNKINREGNRVLVMETELNSAMNSEKQTKKPIACQFVLGILSFALKPS